MKKKHRSEAVNAAVSELKKYLIKNHPSGANTTTLMGPSIPGEYSYCIAESAIQELSKESGFSFINGILFFEGSSKNPLSPI